MFNQQLNNPNTIIIPDTIERRWSKATTTYQVGEWVEAISANYLMKQGLTRLHQNFRCRIGEVDLIMQDKHYLVFIEVRYRYNDDFGGAKASITREKQRKVRKVAEYYLRRFGRKSYSIFCRFDVIAAVAVSQGLKIEWIKDAF